MTPSPRRIKEMSSDVRRDELKEYAEEQSVERDMECAGYEVLYAGYAPLGIMSLIQVDIG